MVGESLKVFYNFYLVKELVFSSFSEFGGNCRNIKDGIFMWFNDLFIDNI